jgi:hypothetical protein
MGGQRSRVMTDTPPPPAPDRALLLAALPSAARAPIETLFALDSRLAGIVRATREPMVGQMRLTWWHEALTKLDGAPAPAEPLLRDVQQHLLPAGVSGARLAGMIDGWEELIVADALTAETLDRHAEARGAGLAADGAGLGARRSCRAFVRAGGGRTCGRRRAARVVTRFFSALASKAAPDRCIEPDRAAGCHPRIGTCQGFEGRAV